MKNIIIILSVFTLILNSCGQAPKNALTIKQEESSEREYFVANSDWKDVKCKEYQEDNGFHTIQECIFPNADLKQVYNIIKEIEPNLKPKLPSKNLTYYPIENDCKMINYEYQTKKHLLIRIDYNEKMTYIEIIQKKKETQSYIIYSGWNF